MEGEETVEEVTQELSTKFQGESEFSKEKLSNSDANLATVNLVDTTSLFNGTADIDNTTIDQRANTKVLNQARISPYNESINIKHNTSMKSRLHSTEDEKLSSNKEETFDEGPKPLISEEMSQDWSMLRHMSRAKTFYSVSL